ncbi:MAG: hypothetical protein MZV65_44885 [Chromatiales bacterium]|nr:hypothetical protein [Chromatiales bacterium]
MAKAGYRYFDQHDEDNGFVRDMAAHGFYPGPGIRFWDLLRKSPAIGRLLLLRGGRHCSPF